MLNAAARFVLPLAVTAAGLLGQNCSPKIDGLTHITTHKKTRSVPKPDGAVAFVQGAVPPDRFGQFDRNTTFLIGAVTERNGDEERYYPTEEYYAYGDGRESLTLDDLRVVFGKLAAAETKCKCKTVVANFRARKTLRILGDTAVRGEIYHNDTIPENISLNQEITPVTFYAALGDAFCDTGETLAAIDYTPYGMRSLPAVAAADLPVGSQILFHTNANDTLHHGRFTHPLRNMMEWMNPAEIGYAISLERMLGISILATDLQNDPHLVVVSDEPVEPVIVDGETVYGGTHELYIMNIKQLTQRMMDAEFEDWEMPEDGVPGVPTPGRIVKAVKKDAKGQKFETLDIDHLYQDGVDTETKSYLLAIMTAFARQNYKSVGVKGADYFRQNLLKPTVK
jgi:hypothetical protein